MLISSILCSFLPLYISGGPKKKKGMNEKRKQLTVYPRLVPGAGCSFVLLEDRGWLPNLGPDRDNGQLTQFSETHLPPPYLFSLAAPTPADPDVS